MHELRLLAPSPLGIFDQLVNSCIPRDLVYELRLRAPTPAGLFDQLFNSTNTLATGRTFSYLWTTKINSFRRVLVHTKTGQNFYQQNYCFFSIHKP